MRFSDSHAYSNANGHIYTRFNRYAALATDVGVRLHHAANTNPYGDIQAHAHAGTDLHSYPSADSHSYRRALSNGQPHVGLDNCP